MPRYPSFRFYPRLLAPALVVALGLLTPLAIAQHEEESAAGHAPVGEQAKAENKLAELLASEADQGEESSPAQHADTPEPAQERSGETASQADNLVVLEGDTETSEPTPATATDSSKPHEATPEGADASAELLSEIVPQLRSAPLKTESGGKPKHSPELLDILGTLTRPGESHRLLWVASETSYGSKLETPVYVIRGKHPGLTLCLTASIHGDELNGIEIVRKVVSDLSPDDLYGTVIGVPIVNLLGFTRGSRYLPDRRDLNRYFPGNPYGSSASRIAHSFFQDIVTHCDLLIDLHTGSLNRTNMAQVRANLQIPEVLEFTTKFGSTAVLHSRKLRGNLRSAATNQGIPAVALELGEPGSLQKKHIEEGVEIIETVLSGLDMTRRLWTVGGSQPVFYRSRWVRVNYGGLLVTKVKVGERIREGDVLGTIANPLTNESFKIVSPYSGRILGMALNQFMLPGYAAFNVGIVADEETAVADAQTVECTSTAIGAEQASEEFGCVSEEDEEIERFDLEETDAEGRIEAEGEGEGE